MLWASWTVPTLLVFCAALALWVTEPRTTTTTTSSTSSTSGSPTTTTATTTTPLSLFVAIGCVLICCSIAPELIHEYSGTLYDSCMSAITTFHLDRLVLANINMIVTGAALVWLLRRAFQTLWKPVPELIGILGVEVPVPPDVSLTAIGADKATVTWTRPPPNRPVHKFVIQVNGVNVGESATNQDTFITVSGLKPDHFYNVRVIAVGSNNFQAGSRVLRLRTFGRDGRPRLGTSRLPPGFLDNERPARQSEAAEENGSARPLTATFSSTTGQDGGPPLTRDGGSPAGSGPASRRNTVGRRHSPSTGSLEQPPLQSPLQSPLPVPEDTSDPSQAEMDDLNRRYLALRQETEETIAMVAKEEEDARRMVDELELEKQERRKEQKKKEEQTEKLKREQGTTDRSMRAALQKKAQKEKQLKERKADLARVRESIAKLDKGIEDMRREQEHYVKQRAELEAERNSKTQSLRSGNADLQEECSRLEAELKDKRQQVKELEDERKELPGGEADAELLEVTRKKWQRTEIEHRTTLLHENRRQQGLDNHLQILSAQLRQIPQTNFGGPYTQAQVQAQMQVNNAIGFDFDGGSSGQLKRRSRNSNSLSNVGIPSPAPAYSMMDPSISAAGFGGSRISAISAPPGFVNGPFMGMSADQPDLDEAGFRALTAGAPLSPSATSLLPSNIFADDEPPSPTLNPLRASPTVPTQPASPDNDPQSPSSSSRSMSILSSPRGSSQNLPFPPFPSEASAEVRSLNGTLSSPAAVARSSQLPGHHKLGNLFSFQRPSRDVKALEEFGPALGSLKHGQSQSFPRQTDEAELGNKSRRISLSAWGMFNRNSAGPEILEGHLQGPPKSGFSARNLFPFGSRAAASNIFSERDPSSPRPASIASSEMPRPSTDSASIWGPPAETLVGKPMRLWSPDNTWSRNPSRRPSLHGSPSALKTNLASADDEILDEEDLQRTSPSVGVIGSGPRASKKSLAKSLNPAAPTFMTSLFRPKPDKEKDKEKDSGKEKDKAKGKEKDKDKSKDKSKEGKDKGKSRDGAPETPVGPPTLTVEESPSDSRKSRDGFSVHTQTSVSESRESLSLEHSFSNSPSEPNSSSTAKDQENAFRKLFRKDSTSKLSSFSHRIRRTKGPGSVTNSEKNMSTTERSSIGDFDDLGDEGAFGRSFDSVTSSPSLGPSKSRDRAEGKSKASGSWFSIKKKSREKESLEIERDRLSEAETPAEEEKKA